MTTPNTKKSTVLIVDDSTQDLQTILEYLKNDYAVIAATSGEAAIEKAADDPRPDVILMDVTMPGMDGYQACKQIIENDNNADIIFVSANDTTEEILKGYDVGGIDYVVKPFDPSILESKIDLAIKSREAKNNLAEQSQLATDAAMTAMSNSGELSVIIDFMRNSFKVDEFGQLAQLLVSAFGEYGLNGSTQICSEFETINIGKDGTVSPLEAELLSRMQNHPERFMEKGCRLFLNYGNVAGLIKNMPIDDEELYGRLKDCLMILAEAAQSKIRSLEYQHASSANRRSSMQQVIANCRQALVHFKTEQEEHQKASVSILDKAIQEVEASFLTLGLTEEQEEDLLAILNKGVEKSLAHFEEGTELDENLGKIINQLEKLTL